MNKNIFENINEIKNILQEIEDLPPPPSKIPYNPKQKHKMLNIEKPHEDANAHFIGTVTQEHSHSRGSIFKLSHSIKDTNTGTESEFIQINTHYPQKPSMRELENTRYLNPSTKDSDNSIKIPYTSISFIDPSMKVRHVTGNIPGDKNHFQLIQELGWKFKKEKETEKNMIKNPVAKLITPSLKNIKLIK